MIVIISVQICLLLDIHLNHLKLYALYRSIVYISLVNYNAIFMCVCVTVSQRRLGKYSSSHLMIVLHS